MGASKEEAIWRYLHMAGMALIAVSAFVLILTFYPILKEEVRYEFSPKNNAAPVMTKEEAKAMGNTSPDVMTPVDEEFGIVIPKISANSRVIADVDWENSREYQVALTKGVAQAKGTALPENPGNMFVFAHSGVDFYEAARYNAVFYLIDKLSPGDEAYIFHQGKKFTYRITGKKMVGPNETQYLTGAGSKKTLTLMTCWPPGTTMKRLIVQADQVEN